MTIAAALSPAEVADRAARASVRSRRLLALPALAMISLFGILPLLIIVAYSFLKPGAYGGVEWQVSTTAYQSFLFQADLFDGTLTFSPDYLLIYARTALYAFATMALTLAFGFPTAYYMATRPPAERNWWVLLITIPFWSNLLIRTLAVMFVIRDEGLLNTVLMKLGVISHPIEMLYTDFAILLGLFYSFLPFMVLPLFSSLEKLDFRLVEAGHDLYANRRRVLWHVILPLAKPGIIAGCLLVFVPALGAYVTPLLLGGGKHLMIGDLIALQFGVARNWPLGSAMALILLAFILILLVIQARNGAKGGPNG